MGRRKLEIKRIQDKNSRRVAFSKRRTGLFKKARQISVLCDVDVAVAVSSERGKLYEFCSGGTHRYQKSWLVPEERSTQEGVCEDMVFNNPCIRFRTCKELLKSVRRVGEEPNEVSVSDLIELEEELTAALFHTRSKMTKMMIERISTFHEQEMKLIEANEELKQQVVAKQKDYIDVDDLAYETPQQLFTLPLFKE